MIVIVYDDGAGACGTAARMEKQVQPRRGFVENDPFVRIAIDIQDATGILLADRNKVLREVKPDQETLAPRHRELSGHSQC